jgi:hypothetical protein
VFVLLGYYYYQISLRLFSSGTLSGSVDDEVIHSFYTSGEVCLFIVDFFCSFLVVGVLLKMIQAI